MTPAWCVMHRVQQTSDGPHVHTLLRRHVARCLSTSAANMSRIRGFSTIGTHCSFLSLRTRQESKPWHPSNSRSSSYVARMREAGGHSRGRAGHSAEASVLFRRVWTQHQPEGEEAALYGVAVRLQATTLRPIMRSKESVFLPWMVADQWRIQRRRRLCAHCPSRKTTGPYLWTRCPGG